MAIEGDIDLTENLDFRVDKPEKLLPSTQLKSATPKSMKSLADKNQFYPVSSISLDQNYYWYNDDSSTISFGINLNATSGNLTTYSISYYDNNTDYICSMYDQQYYGLWGNNTYYSTVSNVTSTSWSTNLSYYSTPMIGYEEEFSFDKKKEKDHSLNGSLWDDEDFVLGDKRVTRNQRSPIDDWCQDDEEDDRSDQTKDFLFTPDYWIDEDEGWNAISDHTDLFDVIPWFSKMTNSRIRKDYIDSLYDEEQDFDSYLTNYRWLGLH